jgi:uncharacterized protein YciI
MKFIPFLFIIFSIVSCAFSSGQADQAAPQMSNTPLFDGELAYKLGADDYGMSRYVIAFLYAGENRDLDSTEAVELQRAHLRNIKRMSDEGTLVIAGPFLDGGDLRGIYIFNVDSVDEARSLTETDPAIQAGSLKMDLKPWYGSAALKEVSTLHAAIQKVKF